jgi:hypothetical protein
MPCFYNVISHQPSVKSSKRKQHNHKKMRKKNHPLWFINEKHRKQTEFWPWLIISSSCPFQNHSYGMQIEPTSTCHYLDHCLLSILDKQWKCEEPQLICSPLKIPKAVMWTPCNDLIMGFGHILEKKNSDARDQ